MQELGEVPRVERNGNVRAVGLDRQVFFEIADFAARAHGHIVLRDVEAHEIVVLIRTRHQHCAVDSILEQRFGNVHVRVEVLRHDLAVIDELAVDEPSRDRRRVELDHEIVFVHIEPHDVVIALDEPRDLHDRANGNDNARRCGGGNERLDALGEPVPVERDRYHVVLVDFEKHAFERGVRVVGADRERDLVHEILDVRVFDLEILRVGHVVYLGELLGGIATELALTALVVDAQSRARRRELNGLRGELFDELAEYLSGHDRVAGLDDVRADHVLYRQLEIGSGEGERAAFRSEFDSFQHWVCGPRRDRFDDARHSIAEIVTVAL